MADHEQNIVLGRGRLHFGKYKQGSSTPGGQRYLGNTTEFNLAQAEENLDHYNSDDGVNEKNRSVTLSQDTSGAFTCDDISKENLALWFLGSASQIVIASAAGVSEVLTDVELGRYYQLGASTSMPQGHGGIDNFSINSPTGVKATGTLTLSGTGTAADTVTINGHLITMVASGAAGQQINVGASATATAQNLKTYINAHPATGVVATGSAAVLTLTALVGGVAGNAITTTEVGTATAFGAATLTGGATGPIAADGNWEVDLERGRLYIFDTAVNIAEGDDLTVTYDVEAQSVETVISSKNSIYGEMFFQSNAVEGDRRDGFFPKVKVTPDGDYNLKGDDWQTMSFNIEVLKATGKERVYWTNRGPA